MEKETEAGGYATSVSLKAECNGALVPNRVSRLCKSSALPTSLPLDFQADRRPLQGPQILLTCAPSAFGIPWA